MRKAIPLYHGKYTGQEDQAARERMTANPPHILLINYMMLELIITRAGERPLREAICDNLAFLFSDELHTYRGRQGADVAMLIRRIRALCSNELTCIGTSATMVSGAGLEGEKEKVAHAATTIFGSPFTTGQIVNEKLVSSFAGKSRGTTEALREAVTSGKVPATYAGLQCHPAAGWIKNSIALDELDGTLVRRQ